MANIGFQQFDEQLAQARIETVERDLEDANLSNEVLQEAYTDAVRQMMRFEDVGWSKLGFAQSDNFNNLIQARGLAEKIQEYVTTNPLLFRANEIRCSYQFSQPYKIGTQDAKGAITPQQQNIFDKRANQDAVFSLQALESIESQRFWGGTVFVQYDRAIKEFQQIPFPQIADVIYDPLDSSRIRYVKRVTEYIAVDSRNGQPTPRKEEYWVPASRYEPGSEGFFKKIGDVRVDTSKRMIVSRVNRKPGSVFGVPDAFAAVPWALAYSAYLRDGTKVLAALAEWVWKVTPQKRPAAERAANSVRRNPAGNAGGTLFTDMDVQALPKADAVDLNTGRPLASQVAAATGISIVVLLADPGQSGAYGTAQTLSDPNRRTMQARRELNTAFLIECLELIGIKNPAVIWGKMSPGTDQEEADLLAQAWGTGLYHPEEIRPRLAEIAQIELTSDDAPEGVLIPNNEASWARADIDPKEDPNGSKSTVDSDGTTSQNNGVGRDNNGLGARSRKKTDANQSGANNPE